MKIRHKQSGVELEGDFVRVSESYFRMPLSIPHGGSCYAASEWEAVPEWVDVTGACELNGAVSCMVMCGGVEIRACDGYRLRKVRLDQPLGGSRWAFIVERKA